MNKSRNTSTKQRRKPKTKVKKDCRLHVPVAIPAVSRQNKMMDTEAINKRTMLFINSVTPSQWTKQEILTLIDHYAAISWGLNTSLHRHMVSNWRIFKQIYIKQRGLCAVTGIPIFGGPSLGANGIGIDLLQYGKLKGNIRLTIPYLSLIRYRHVHLREPTYGRPFEKHDFPNEPITYAIFKSFQELIIERNPFNHLPVNMECKTRYYTNPMTMCFGITLCEPANININFNGGGGGDRPSKEDYLRSQEIHWKFCKICLKDDTITLGRITSYKNEPWMKKWWKDHECISPCTTHMKVSLAAPEDILETMYTWLSESPTIIPDMKLLTSPHKYNI